MREKNNNKIHQQANSKFIYKGKWLSLYDLQCQKLQFCSSLCACGPTTNSHLGKQLPGFAMLWQNLSKLCNSGRPLQRQKNPATSLHCLGFFCIWMWWCRYSYLEEIGFHYGLPKEIRSQLYSCKMVKRAKSLHCSFKDYCFTKSFAIFTSFFSLTNFHYPERQIKLFLNPLHLCHKTIW